MGCMFLYWCGNGLGSPGEAMSSIIWICDLHIGSSILYGFVLSFILGGMLILYSLLSSVS